MRRSASLCFVFALVGAGCGRDPALAGSNWPEDAPGPVGAGPGVRIFSGPAATLSASRSCTAEVGADGDRWCVFVGLSSAGDSNLFAVNVSQVVAGVPVSCDAPDPNCLLLTTSVRGSSADSHPTFFAGDTLVYYDQTFTPHVWRPGMEAGRVLQLRAEVRDMALCTPASHGMAVACLGIPFEQPDGSIVVADLYVGAADGESEPLLESIDSVIAATQSDNERVHRFGFGAIFDDYVAWSSRETPEGPELLEVAKVDDPASAITVASDVHKWDLSTDGSRWLWLRGANELGVGTLQTAQFPDGVDETDVLGGVYRFEITRSGAVLALTMDDEIVSIVDPLEAPDEQVSLGSEVARLLAWSDEGHVAYSQRLTGSLNDLLVSSSDGEHSCVFETTASVSQSSVHFSPVGSTILFARSTAEGYDAYLSRLADCSTRELAPGVVVLGWIGRGHAVFIDDFNPDRGTGSLRFRKVGHDGELHPDPPALIAENVDTYATWGPDLLLYAIRAGTEEDGAYVRAFGQ